MTRQRKTRTQKGGTIVQRRRPHTSGNKPSGYSKGVHPNLFNKEGTEIAKQKMRIRLAKLARQGKLGVFTNERRLAIKHPAAQLSQQSVQNWDIKLPKYPSFAAAAAEEKQGGKRKSRRSRRSRRSRKGRKNRQTRKERRRSRKRIHFKLC